MKIEESTQKWGLDANLVQNLTNKGLTEFFPVQSEVIPVLLKQNIHPCIYPQDICVSAPTGSGKTLSYALPIAHTLMVESVVRLRALILLPNRELAVQVHQVFTEVLQGTRLKVAMVTGSRSLAEEQSLLVGRNKSSKERSSWALDPDLAATEVFVEEFDEFGKSLVDILISTPGRLLDHLQFTEGFTLEHIRFLVLDEADRLLGNAYHGWVRTLINSTENTRSSHFNVASNPLKKRKKSTMHSGYGFDLKLPLQRLLFSATLTDDPSALALLGINQPLFIHSKGLGFSKHSIDNYDSDDNAEEEEFQKEVSGWNDSFELPEQLLERKLVVETKDRVLALISMLLSIFNGEKIGFAVGDKVRETKSDDFCGVCAGEGSLCIIFVSSVDASHRLSLLLRLINNQTKDTSLDSLRREICTRLNIHPDKAGFLFRGKVEEMTRLIKPAERENIIQQAGQGKVSIIVSSDRMARGIDFPNLKLVFNYDLPKHSKTYVHRAGRTARAGREGMCITLIKKGQIGDFKRMRSEIGFSVKDESGKLNELDAQVRNCFLPRFYQDAVVPLYERALSRLPSITGH